MSATVQPVRGLNADGSIDVNVTTGGGGATAANQLLEIADLDTLVASRGFFLPTNDYASLAQAALTDTWTFKLGGSGGTTVATVTITYTDSSKATISTVAKT